MHHLEPSVFSTFAWGPTDAATCAYHRMAVLYPPPPPICLDKALVSVTILIQKYRYLIAKFASTGIMAQAENHQTTAYAGTVKVDKI